MEGSDDAYRTLLLQLRERMPEVASQVESEVARGHLVRSEVLAEPDRRDRNARMKETKSGRLSKDDLTVVDYSGDERLGLLLDALRRLAMTMLASRSEIGALVQRHELPPAIIFSNPDETDPAGEEVALDTAAVAVTAERASGV